MSQHRSNIIFIQCDSMDGRAMGCMDHPAAVTPALDALAGRGVLFRNTYSNNPICCPSRASMWSGLYTHHCKAWNNEKGLAEDAPTFLTSLQDADLDCAVIGRTDHLSGKHTERARVSAWTRSAGIDLPAYRMSPPTVLESDESRVSQSDWKRLDQSIAWLRSRNGPRPFFLYLGLDLPHPPFQTSRYWLDRIDPAKVFLPRPDPTCHPVMEHQNRVKNWEYGFSEATVHLVRRIYYAMIAEVDAIVGGLVREVDRLGLTDSTWIVFSSDHGEMAMEHNQFYKMNHYEASVRVPMIVAGPSAKSGLVVEDPVSLVDVYPTLLDMAGTAENRPLDGFSLLPEATGGHHPGRPGWVLSEYHDTSSRTGAFMLRRGRWKYIAYVGYEPLLFDLESDPDEVRNLAPERPDVVRDMDAALRGVVDYEAVDAEVKAYDRTSFRQWRQEQKAAGTYEKTMARIHSGWDHLAEHQIIPWDDDKEAMIRTWLGEQP